MRARMLIAAAAAAAALPLAGPVAPSPASATEPETVLVSEGERLWAFDVDGGVVSNRREFLPDSEWVNGPPCFIPGDSAHRFYEADDNPDAIFTDHSNVDGDAHPFFGLFSNSGEHSFGTDVANQILVDDSDHGALTLWDPDPAMLDPAGCAFDANGNLVVVDVGVSHTPMKLDGEPAGFVAIFFKAHHNTGADFTTSCVLDADLSQPGFPAFDASGRMYLPESGNATIWRYGTMPTDASQCAAARASRERWAGLEETGLATPIAITPAPGGGWAVSSVLVPPAIVHLDANGTLDGIIAAPGPQTGTPFGLGYDRAGNLFYADLGIRPFPGATEGDPSEPIGPGDNQGALKMVRAGSLLPETIASGWDFPDGLTIVPAGWLTK